MEEMNGYFVRSEEEDNDESITLTWPVFTVYAMNTVDVGRIIRILSELTDGDVNVRFTSDDEGNTVYTISGIVDDIYLIEELERRCDEQGVAAQFSY